MNEMRVLAPRLLAGFEELRPMLGAWQSQLRGATTGAIEDVAAPLVAARERSAAIAAHMADLTPGKPPSDPAVMFGQIDPGIGAAIGTITRPDPGEYGWLYGELADEIGKRAASGVNARTRSVMAFTGIASDRISGALYALDRGAVVGGNVSVRSQARQGVEALDHAQRSLDHLTFDLRMALGGAN